MRLATGGEKMSCTIMLVTLSTLLWKSVEPKTMGWSGAQLARIKMTLIKLNLLKFNTIDFSGFIVINYY